VAAASPARAAGSRTAGAFRWQITPKRLLELVTDQDSSRARRAMQAMTQMSKIDTAALERAAAGGSGVSISSA
jgi:hypothetical protein